MINASKQKIELISDPNLNLVFRKAISSRMSVIAKQYLKSDYLNSGIKSCNKK